VDGSWAGGRVAGGDYRAQLGRAAAWLDAHGAPSETPESLAEAALRAAGLDEPLLMSSQIIGGDADGAVLTPGADALRPTAQTIALTAALALLI
jgi:hypothetical protein